MLPFFREDYGNAASTDHMFGIAAKRAVDDAREAIAELVCARPEDVIFTSGSTEANNIALSVPHRVLTTPVEHPSILDCIKARRHLDDSYLDIDRFGRVDVANLVAALSDRKPTTVAIIATNNELGTEQDVTQIARLIKEADALLHYDATQAVVSSSLDMRGKAAIDSVALSAHKLYGPKGVGALIAGSRLRRSMRAIAHGGGHERGFRPGTLNVPGIVGFGVAARIAVRETGRRRAHLSNLRAAFLTTLREKLGSNNVVLTVPENVASPHIVSLRLVGINGRALLVAMQGEVAFSLGSACATNKTEPSHVLLALGFDKKTISQIVRISFSAQQSEEEVRDAAATIAETAAGLRAFSVHA